ncbi:ribulose phosphate epimerase [Paraliomyxa miuraensis]|uniref:ribulose phosphate epimerase n=1 Tax=Paraliomyxa miuraensis TaxID=376150 RepID=UPI0022512879|nr:ribulose phosphate epimerase [Paraliomyxa miuraensis]MCX4241522.1 ribulose phosphate epimerase [Paraliomyxa miuraensis]
MRSWTRGWGVVVIAMGIGGACGPIVQLDDETGSGDEGSTTSIPPPSTTVPSTTSPGTTAGTTITTTSTTASETFGESPGDETWSNFIPQPDDLDWGDQCGIFEQDCPEGEKCMPWANDGGNSWNATRCSPVAEDPDGLGEACVVEGSGVSGVDSCDYGLMCWDVDPDTNEGTCVAFCVGSEENPFCEDENSTCLLSSDGVLALCLPHCDPLLQDCNDGRACYPINDEFMCAVDASGDMGEPGDPCEYINVCDGGNFCASADVVPDCMGNGCCTPFCALDDLMPPCLPGQVCTPWYEPGLAPPGYENVGACVLPM